MFEPYLFLDSMSSTIDLFYTIEHFWCNSILYHQWIAVANDSKQTELPTADEVADERSEGDRIVDGMDFGELCDEFECISSPLVEATARQLVRDILQLRQANRALECFATAVKYKVVLQLRKLFHHCSISLLKVKSKCRILSEVLLVETSTRDHYGRLKL